MTDKEVMQMALETLEQMTPDWRTSIDKHEQLNNSIEAIRTALAQPESAECDGGQCGIGGYCKECAKTQPEQEPVAWMYSTTGTLFDTCPQDADEGEFLPLYTAPPKKEWVGLTDGEYELMAEKRVTNYFFNTLDYAHDIEAKLKEKNT